MTTPLQRYKMYAIRTNFVSFFAHFRFFLYFCSRLSAPSSQNVIIMSVPTLFPIEIAVALHKGEFAYCVGITRYKLTKFIKQNEKNLTRLGYSKYDKVLTPRITEYILSRTGLRIDAEKLAQCIGPRSRSLI